MRVKFYGTAPGMPVLSKRHSCVRVSMDELNFILDCGEGASQAFLEYKDNPDNLDFIFLTHLHPDHSSGIFMLLQMMAMKKRTKTLFLFVPENINEFARVLNYFYIFQQNLSFKLEIYLCEQISQFFPQLSLFHTDHLLMNKETVAKSELPNRCFSFGVKIVEKEKTVIYTSDIAAYGIITENLNGCDVCITTGFHPKITEYEQLTNIVKMQILLTHGAGEGVKEMVARNKKFIIVEDGDEVDIK